MVDGQAPNIRDLLFLAAQLGVADSEKYLGGDVHQHQATSPAERREYGRREGSKWDLVSSGEGRASRSLAGSPGKVTGSPGASGRSPSSLFQREMTSRYLGMQEQLPQPPSAQDPVSMSILDTMRLVSREKRLAHEAEVQKAGLRLKTKLYPGVSKDLLAQRRENLAQVQSHVEEIIKVPNDALAARVHNAFARPHLSLGQEHHAHVLSVVDDAVTDLVMASKDLDVIAYTKKSCVPLEQVQGAGKQVERLVQRRVAWHGAVSEARESLLLVSRGMAALDQRAAFA